MLLIVGSCYVAGMKLAQSGSVYNVELLKLCVATTSFPDDDNLD